MRAFLFQVSVFTIALISQAFAEPQIHCTGNEANRDTYLKMHQALFMERDTSRVRDFYANEIISHNNDGGGSGVFTVIPDQMAAFWEESKKNDPSRVLDDELILCIDDFVVVRTTVTGINEGPILGYPATGKPYAATAIDIYRFQNGKVVERWGNADVISRYRQLGFKMVPEADQGP